MFITHQFLDVLLQFVDFHCDKDEKCAEGGVSTSQSELGCCCKFLEI